MRRGMEKLSRLSKIQPTRTPGSVDSEDEGQATPGRKGQMTEYQLYHGFNFSF